MPLSLSSGLANFSFERQAWGPFDLSSPKGEPSNYGLHGKMPRHLTAMRTITDPEVALLASIAATLKGDYEGKSNLWVGSPFEWVVTLPSSVKGKIGAQLVSGWCAAKGFSVGPSGDSEADRIIAGRRIEIKFSTLWTSGVYKFQQIRDQNYEYVICLGLAPFDAHCWVISKECLRVHVIGQTGQHRGKAATDTFWISFLASNPHDWLKECGGKLARAFEVLQRVRKD